MSRKQGALAMLVGLSLLALVAPAAVAGARTATPIQHVIIIVQENHSFDNYFGTYPTANGTLVNSITSQLPPVVGIPNSVCVPYRGGCLSPTLSTSSAPADPSEGQLVYEADYANNATGFAANSGPQSMVYFDYHSVPAYWDYAEEYGLGDNYFSAVLSETTPNRLMLLTGDTPVAADNPAPPYLPYSESVMSQLDGAGVSWGYYDYLSSPSAASTLYPLDYLSGIPQSALSNVKDLSSLYGDLSSGSGLPSVSFVNSLNNKTYDEHPAANPSSGEQWVVSVVNRVMESAYWNTTAIFITWDEGGGFYDQVVPPAEFTIDHGFQSPLLGYGQRVPLLVISPYSIEAHVSSTLLSHLSLIRFIDYNWNLPALNSNVADAGLPLDFFNFSQHARPPIVLGTSGAYSSSTYPVPLQIPLSAGATQTSSALVSAGTGGYGAMLQLGLSGGLILAGTLVLVAVWRVRARPASSHVQDDPGRDRRHD
ncbi:MAG: acid phosphatase [Nitrososphaerota archaeon]|nr:acid phosphatase [Nitrososphaerota archaeon]